MDWIECRKRKIVKEISPDLNLIESLKKTSDNKRRSELKLEMSEITAGSKLSLAYDSLRELLEALALKNGYKMYNHEGYTAFLKEILNENERAEEFDELRRIRNDVNYYGKEISTKEAKNIIEGIIRLRDKILKLLDVA